MLLTKLLRGTALEDQAAVSDREITGLTCDSRTVTPGALFAAFRGSRTDGNRFIREALDKGATAVLCQTPPAGQDGPWLVTDDPRAVFGQMAAHWFGDPGRRMTLIGVTGTNGTTTRPWGPRSASSGRTRISWAMRFYPPGGPRRTPTPCKPSWPRWRGPGAAMW